MRRDRNREVRRSCEARGSTVVSNLTVEITLSWKQRKYIDRWRLILTAHGQRQQVSEQAGDAKHTVINQVTFMRSSNWRGISTKKKKKPKLVIPEGMRGVKGQLYFCTFKSAEVEQIATWIKVDALNTLTMTEI